LELFSLRRIPGWDVWPTADDAAGAEATVLEASYTALLD
jgi:hypothetical protein